MLHWAFGAWDDQVRPGMVVQANVLNEKRSGRPGMTRDELTRLEMS